MTLHIVDLRQYYVCCARSGVIRCTLFIPYGALPEPYVPVRVTRGAVIAHWYTYKLPRCRTSEYCRAYIHLSVSLWNDLGAPIFLGVGWRVSRAGPMPFYWPSASFPFCLLLFSLLSFLTRYCLFKYISLNNVCQRKFDVQLNLFSIPTYKMPPCQTRMKYRHDFQAGKLIWARVRKYKVIQDNYMRATGLLSKDNEGRKRRSE